MARPRPGWNGFRSCLDAAPSLRKGPDQARRPNRAVRAPAQNPGRDRREGPAEIRLAHHGESPWRNRDCSKTAEVPRRTSMIGSKKCWRTPAWARGAAVSSSSSKGESPSTARSSASSALESTPPAHGSRSTGSRSSSNRWSIMPSTNPRLRFNIRASRTPALVDLLPEIPERVYTVGRLDEASTGLLILTNDDDHGQPVAHPRYGVEKIYRALVAGLPTPEMLAKLTEGVWLSDGKVRAKRARIVSRQGQATMLELVLAEGKKREIRRMLSKLGHKVMSLNRIAVGPISLKGLSAGECRSLSRHEIELLRKVASGDSVAPPRFSDGDSSSRPHGASRRPLRPGQARSARNNDPSAPRPDHSLPRHSRQDGNGPPQRRPRHAQSENAPHAGSKRSQHSDSRPHPSTSVSSNSQSPKANKGRRGPAKLPPKPRGKTSKPVGSRRPSASTSRPPEPLKPRRRIIGLDLDSAVPDRPDASGEGSRKRPPARKRRPAGPVLGKKRKPSAQADRRDDEGD